MNHIGGLAFKWYELFDYKKNAVSLVSQIIPERNTIVGRVVGNTMKLGKSVLSHATPHAINISPWYLSKTTTMRICSILMLPSFGMIRLYNLPLQSNWIDIATSITLTASEFIGFADLYGMTPLEINCRRIADFMPFLATIIGSGGAVFEGINQMLLSLNSEEGDITSTISSFVLGTTLTTLGVVGIAGVFTKKTKNFSILSNTEEEIEVSKLLLKQRLLALLNRKNIKLFLLMGHLEELTPLAFRHCHF